jgi:hypothetical protein
MYAGGGTEYAAIATKWNTVAPAVNAPTGVFQANVGTAPNRLRGTWSASNRKCPSDITNKVIADLPTFVDSNPIGGATYDVSTPIAGPAPKLRYVKAQGDLTITAGASQNIANGKQTIYSPGNVYITGSGLKQSLAGVSDDSTAPVLTIVASGNIYIDASVSQLDAILISNGEVFTCSSGFAGIVQADTHTLCNSKLTINGAVNAHYIHFQRAIGTRLASAAYEKSTDAGAAESINYPYYLYFSTPYLLDTSASAFQAYFNPAPFF